MLYSNALPDTEEEYENYLRLRRHWPLLARRIYIHPHMTSAQLLEENLSDITLRRTRDPAKLDALFAAASIAIPTILRAAAAGNVQCREASVLLQPHLTLLLE